MNLENALLAWDGKSTGDITNVFRAHCEQPAFVERLISLIKTSPAQKGASWLLKAWFDDGRSISDEQVSALFGLLEVLESWEAKLHILQCLPYLSIHAQHKSAVEKFLRATLPDSNKFVRAWSYNGYYELARQHAEYRVEVERLFDIAMRDEVASVKARIRNVMKKGF